MESWEVLCDEPQPLNDSENLLEFAYEPLASPHGCIRLIDILEVSTDGTIICAMKEKQFIKGSYNALSYCWGPSRPLYRIIINNKALYIRKNLRDFLYSARTAHEDACHDIWIDAICINQSDFAERAIQVGQMHHIFSNASVVYAWIGNWDTRFGSAFQKLEEPDTDIPRTCNKYSSLDISMRHLFARDYWSRMWIVQENILASNIRLLCGGKSLAWNTRSVSQLLKTAVSEQWTGNPSKKQANSRNMSVAQSLVGLSVSRDQGDNTADLPTLYELLSQFGQGECAEIHDRIYSLLGLFPEGPSLRVDYTISTPALFFNVLLALERKRGFRDCVVLRHALSLSHQELENYWTSHKSQHSNSEDIAIHLSELKSIKEWSNPLAPETEFTPLNDELRPSDYIWEFARMPHLSHALILRDDSSSVRDAAGTMTCVALGLIQESQESCNGTCHADPWSNNFRLSIFPWEPFQPAKVSKQSWGPSLSSLAIRISPSMLLFLMRWFDITANWHELRSDQYNNGGETPFSERSYWKTIGHTKIRRPLLYRYWTHYLHFSTIRLKNSIEATILQTPTLGASRIIPCDCEPTTDYPRTSTIRGREHWSSNHIHYW